MRKGFFPAITVSADRKRSSTIASWSIVETEPIVKWKKKTERKIYARTLFIQEASIAAISHRLDSDRFEPLYAYRPETMLQWIKLLSSRKTGESLAQLKSITN